MSSDSRGRPRPPQALTLVLAYLGFVPLAIIWASFSWIMLTTTGASSMAALMPMAAFMFTSWLWALLAIIALARAARDGRNAHALVVSLAALLLAVLGLVFMLPR